MNKTATKHKPETTLLSPEEARKLLNISMRTLSSWKKEGLLPYVNLGYRNHKFRLSDIEALIESRLVNNRKGVKA